MSLIFEQIHTEGLAQLSYLIGDTGTDQAVVVDPRRDPDVYVRIAREHELLITDVIESHNHADLVSGSVELRALTGCRIQVSAENGIDIGFEHEPLQDGGRFELGGVTLVARHTPGHSPEHMALELIDPDKPDGPWGILTGDCPFAGAARPNLVDKETASEDQLYDTIYNYYLSFPDHVIIYPGHGADGVSGPTVPNLPESTIGHERRHNELLQYADDREGFSRALHRAVSAPPAYYARLKALNAKGPELLGDLAIPPGLSPQHFSERVGNGNVTILDTRDMFAFGGGHIPGAINIGDRPMLSEWAAKVLEPDSEILLVLDEDTDIERDWRFLLRTGVTGVGGYLAGGMAAWSEAGKPIAALPQLSVHGLHQNPEVFTVFDVRSKVEYEGGHVPHAKHHSVLSLCNGDAWIKELDSREPIVTYCGSGYRSSIAASLLRSRGFQHVYNVPGSWSAWKRAGYPVET